MKKIILPALALAILISCKSNESEKDSKDEKSKHKKESSAKRGLDEDEKLEEGNDAIKDSIEMAGLMENQYGTEYDNESKEDDAPVDRWKKESEEAFMESCISEAKKGVLSDMAESYCSCVLEKMERKFPSEIDALKVSSKDMMEMAGDCIDK